MEPLPRLVVLSLSQASRPLVITIGADAFPHVVIVGVFEFLLSGARSVYPAQLRRR